MDRLKIAIQEIQVAKQVIDVSHGSFIKRTLSRMIAMRMHNLIGDQIFYQTNNTVNGADIPARNALKGHLNALRDLYKEFFEQQRHKFSGHFQELPLIERIELWSQIDFTTANFFYENPIELYGHFSSSPDFETTVALFSGFNPSEIDAIRKVCDKHNLEGKPTMSSDILNFTRNNSGGVVSKTAVQKQCGALNALEIIIDFELDLYEALKHNKKAADLVKKMLIVDIINYSDNFFTRQDVLPGDAQYFIGLDDILSADFTKPLSIINEFKKAYKLQDNIDKLRVVRNKFCCHIDNLQPVTDLQLLLDSLDIDVVKRFYSTLSHLLEKIYRSDIRLSPYMVKNDEIKDAVSVEGIGAKMFSPQDSVMEVKPRVIYDYNDETLYEQFLNRIEENPSDEEALTYLVHSIINSEKISDERIEVKSSPYSASYDHFVFRKAQKYLIDVMNSTLTSKKRKLTILNALIRFSPSTEHNNIILKTYDSNKGDLDLQDKYIFYWGEKIHERDIVIYDILQKASEVADVAVKHSALVSIFKIDVSTRVRVIGQENSNESPQSTFIKQSILNVEDPLHRIGLIAGLASELSNSNRLAHVIKFVQGIYLDPFYEMFEQAVTDMVEIVNSPQLTEDIKNRIVQFFKDHNYTVALGKLADHFANNDRVKAAELIYYLFMEGYIRINWNHETSIVNFALFHFRGGKKAYAVQLMEWLIERNPHILDLYSPYLSILKGYDDVKLEKVKQYLKDNYNLDTDDLKSLEEF